METDISEQQPDPNIAGESVRAFKITYSSLGLRDLIRVALAPDEDHPVPAIFRTLCSPRTFMFSPPEWQTSVLTWLMAWCCSIVTIIVVFSRANRTHLLAAAVRDLRWRFVGIWLAVGALTAVVTAATLLLVSYAGVNVASAQSQMFLTDAKGSLVVLALVTVIGPACEELLFRYWLLGGFLRRNFRALGVLLVSATFAGLHFDSSVSWIAAAIQLTVIFALSILLSVVYIRTQNVWASALTHAAYNSTMVLVTWL
ncbi:MAG TPA: CPBP family intramembrane glutamic endopeptidase [Rudaea sp.]|nr:CPBP family intramembrane glutamic endopeptidase [Rudaea sp.]